MASDLDTTYAALRKMLEEESAGMPRRDDPRAGFCVIAGYSPRWQKDLWFGGVRMGKSYVSYYLFPVYMVPGLMAAASPELKKRMQGKSCFNFTRVDPVLFAELRALTRRCHGACADGTLETVELPGYERPAKKAAAKKPAAKKPAPKKAAPKKPAKKKPAPRRRA